MSAGTVQAHGPWEQHREKMGPLILKARNPSCQYPLKLLAENPELWSFCSFKLFKLSVHDTGKGLHTGKYVRCWIFQFRSVPIGGLCRLHLN